MNSAVLLIRMIADLFMWIVIASVILSYFVSPYHPVRQALDRILDPFLAPIRRIVPSAGMIDFSPMILILAIQFLKIILTNVLQSF
jgi:YggT family protein